MKLLSKILCNITSQSIGIISILSLCCPKANADNFSEKNLTIWLMDGTKTAIHLNNHPQVEFLNGNVLISYSDNAIELPEESVCKFTYDDSAAIHDILEDNQFIYNGHSFIIKGNNHHLYLYTISGIEAACTIEYNLGNTIIHTHSLPAGVYVLQIESKTFKFIKG